MFKPWKIKAIAANPDKEWQTRRAFSIQPGPGNHEYVQFGKHPAFGLCAWWPGESEFDTYEVKPRYCVGETVYIKEAHWYPPNHNENPNIVSYREIIASNAGEEAARKNIWRSPLFMPTWAARYFIKIVDVQAQRVKDISELDCLAEGYRGGLTPTGAALTPPYLWYADLWEDINGKGAWAKNPWIWKYVFKVTDRPER